ncbi:AAA family ATPase [Burkholderiaceae bacterium UC74_6]
MKIKRVIIKNFRKLVDIEFELDKNIAVIVGPNAIGKSSVFEAIRLAKAILFPRMQDELRNVLIGLGASSAHFFNGQLSYDISALAGDVSKGVSITLFVELSADEVRNLGDARPTIARSLVAAQLGRSLDDPQLDLRSYFATPMGIQAEKDAMVAVNEAYKSLSGGKAFETRVDITEQSIQQSSVILNLFVGWIERNLRPDKAMVSYFPADRSMPVGEVALQIGPQDFKAQIDSHLAHASAKYGRLKQTVVNQTVLARIASQEIKGEFDSIFETFLPGKEFVGLAQKPTGLISVQIRDRDSGKVFDIDSLSSGEKGLVLSFLLFKSSISVGSVILVDELELHLNPAVCKKILPYLAGLISEKSDCQFIISTHSAEIMRAAYERDDCELFHLRGGADISPILQRDSKEIVEALTRLGVSAEHALTSKSSIYVEGDSDVAILQSSFPAIFSSVGVRALNGRLEIEKSIRELQKAESQGKLKEPHAFLFDLDRKPSGLVGTSFVKIEQLNKYCIENYLLDDVALFDLISEYSSKKPESRGEFSKELKSLALQQLDDEVLREMLEKYRGVRVGIGASELRGKSIAEVAALQLDKLNAGAAEIERLRVDANWAADFENRHAARRSELLPLWENDWKKLCSGKILFEGLKRKYQINLDDTKFRITLAERLSREGKDDITALRGLVERLVS